MLDQGMDQAAGLRRMVRAAPTLSLIALPLDGGAGPGRRLHGDARWIAQLAHSLCALGLRPLVIDGTRGAPVARAFGLNPRHELIDLLHGTAAFDDVALATRDGVRVLRAERGIEAFVASGAPAQQLFAGFARLSHGFDAVLLAMPPAELACLAGPADAVPVIALDGGDAGVMAAYGAVKQLAEGFGYSRFALVANAPAQAHARESLVHAHARLAAAARNFLHAEVSLAGALPAPGRRDDGDEAGLAELAHTLLNTAATRYARAASPV